MKVKLARRTDLNQGQNIDVAIKDEFVGFKANEGGKSYSYSLEEPHAHTGFLWVNF